MAKMQKYCKLARKWMAVPLITLTLCSLGCVPGIDASTILPSAVASLSDTSITMALPDIEAVEQSVQQLVERQAKAWETADSDKIIADFAEDSLFIVPGSTFRGKQQIKEAAEQYFAEFADTKVTIKRIITNENEGAVEWSWSDRNKKTGEISQAEDAIIFELEAEKIKYWREYIDTQPERS